MNVPFLGKWAVILIALVATAIVAVLWHRKRAARSRAGRAGRFLPAGASGPDWTARIAEALVLAVVGAAVLVMAATNRGTGGKMLILDELTPAYARVNVMVFASAAAGVLVAVLVGLLWRTWAAALLMAAVLGAYGLILNGPSIPCGWFTSAEALRPVETYTIRATGDQWDIHGAELWVNGVYLGKTPIQTTPAEFLRKVPYWPDPPEDYETDKVDVPSYGPYGFSTRHHRRWIRFKAPGWRDRPEADRTYYARLKYAGEWAAAGSGSGSGGGGAGVTRRSESHFGVVLPQRARRLEGLLDKARLAGYRVGDRWFEAIQTYNEDGWIALRKAAETEPRMWDVFDAWATWRYGLDEAGDGESAWRIFQGICDESEATGKYLTPSVAGRAVELLADKLRVERLVARAEGLIRRAASIVYSHWEMNGRLQFGLIRMSEGQYRGMGTITGSGSGRRGGALPMEAFPVAHAIWMLHERLSAEPASEPNILQRRITPALIRWHWRGHPGMQIAAWLGGPEIERFCLRQDWAASVRFPSRAWREDRMHIGTKGVNRWLYLLANLRSPAGREFRRRHAERLMALADELCDHWRGRWDESLNFLMLDLELGERSLAMRYWPRFSELARRKFGDDALKAQWRYLLTAEPASAPAMYLDAWVRAQMDRYEVVDTVSVLDGLPLAKRQAVVSAIIEHVHKDVRNITSDKPPEKVREEALVTLQRRMFPMTEADQAVHYLDYLRKDASEDKDTKMALWLAHTRPDHPLVDLLAAQPEAALRLLAIGALRSHPTPARCRGLADLLTDGDPTVRAEAERVADELKALAAAEAMRYASALPGNSSSAPGQ